MIPTSDIFWLAGLLEGEGSFGVRRVNNQWKEKVYTDPIIQLGMTDEDVVRRAATLFGTWCRSFCDKRPNRKPKWQTSVVSSHAAAWMMTLYPLMGGRRRARIAAVLVIWRAEKRRGQFKLTDEQALEIAAHTGSSAAMVKKHGIGKTQVNRIRRGECWNVSNYRKYPD